MILKKILYLFLACTIFCISKLKSLSIYDYCHLFQQYEATRKTNNQDGEKAVLQRIVDASKKEKSKYMKEYLEKNGLKAKTARLVELSKEAVGIPVAPPTPSIAQESVYQGFQTGRGQKSRMGSVGLTSTELKKQEEERNFVRRLGLADINAISRATEPEKLVNAIKPKFTIIKNLAEITAALYHENEIRNRNKINENLKVIEEMKPLIKYWTGLFDRWFSTEGTSKSIFVNQMNKPQKLISDDGEYDDLLEQLEKISRTKEYQEFSGKGNLK